MPKREGIPRVKLLSTPFNTMVGSDASVYNSTPPLEIFRDCEHQWGIDLRPQTDRTYEQVTAHIARQLRQGTGYSRDWNTEFWVAT